jgi:hypothetical protein
MVINVLHGQDRPPSSNPCDTFAHFHGMGHAFLFYEVEPEDIGVSVKTVSLADLLGPFPPCFLGILAFFLIASVCGNEVSGLISSQSEELLPALNVGAFYIICEILGKRKRI